MLLRGNPPSYLAGGSCSGIGDWRARPTLFGGRWAQGHHKANRGREGGRERGSGGNNGQHVASNATLQLRSLHRPSIRSRSATRIQTDCCLITIYRRHRTAVVHLPFPSARAPLSPSFSPPSPLNVGGLLNRNHDAWGEIVFE